MRRIIIATFCLIVFCVLGTAQELEDCQAVTKCSVGVPAQCQSTSCKVSIAWTKCGGGQGNREHGCLACGGCTVRFCMCDCEGEPGGPYTGYSLSWCDCNEVIHIAGGSCAGC